MLTRETANLNNHTISKINRKKKWKALVNSSSNKWVMQHLWMCVRQSFKMTEEHALFTNQKTPDLTNFKHLVRLLHIDIL